MRTMKGRGLNDVKHAVRHRAKTTRKCGYAESSLQTGDPDSEGNMVCRSGLRIGLGHGHRSTLRFRAHTINDADGPDPNDARLIWRWTH